MAILDVFRRMAGMETADEATAAEKTAWNELASRDNSDPIRFFATNAASALRSASDDVLRRKLPEVAMIDDGRIPRAGSRRELHVVKAAEAYAKHYAVGGDNHGMGATLGGAVRRRALDTVNMHGLSAEGSPTVDDRIQARAAAIHLATETYLGIGSLHERALSAAAMACEHSTNAKPLDPNRLAAAEQAIGPLDAERFGHMGPLRHEPAGTPVSMRRAVMAYEVAQARAGILSPDRIVATADAIDIGDMMRATAQTPKPGETIDRVRPDFQNVGMDPRSPRHAEAIAVQFGQDGAKTRTSLPPAAAEMPRTQPGTRALAVHALAKGHAGHGL